MSNLTVNAINGVDVQNIAKQTARAWVNFNGITTTTIRKSFNVASLTDLGAGVTQINFAVALPDVNYVVVAGVSGASTVSTTLQLNYNAGVSTPPTVTSVTVTSVGSGVGAADQIYTNIAVFD